MTTEQTIQDVAMIARNGIDRVIELEREHANRRAEAERLRELSSDCVDLTAAMTLHRWARER